MSGVWVFRNGIAKLVQNPWVESLDGIEVLNNNESKRKVLVFRGSNEIIRSYGHLEEKLHLVGWERYPNGKHQHHPEVVQFHKGYSSMLLITIPRDPRNFKIMHMYDIVLKNRDHFQVRDLVTTTSLQTHFLR